MSALGFAEGKDQHWVVLGKGGATSDVHATPDLRMQTEDIPVVGDWNGDGRPKVGIFRKGLWFLDINGTHTHSKAIGWGQPGDIPVVGDWNGDGRTKIGVFSKGFWYLDMDGSHQVTSSKIIGWGQMGDIPVLGDWNHDGKMKIGVFRSNTWFLDTNGSHQLNAASQITADVK